MSLFGDLKPTRGIVSINPDWCKGCGFCVQYCPADVLAIADNFNAKGYHPPYVKSPEDCTNCKFCEVICPEFTIYTTLKEQDEKGEDERA